MSKGIVKFGNSGIIDPRVWSTFGVSVKESDNAIGQFGTGLKYAIAVLMREGRSLSITSGSNVYDFGVQDTVIRDSEFQQITCNGKALPFTTHLGAKWELWQAYREIYSNCVDEGGAIGFDGDTVVHAELGDIYHSDVFLDKEAENKVTSSPLCDVYAGNSNVIYYRGIRAMDLPRPSKYTYDIKTADLTEDRTIKYQFEVFKAIASALLRSASGVFVYDFITQTKDWFESAVDFDYSHETPSDCVTACVSAHRKKGLWLQEGAYKKVLQALGPEQYDANAPEGRHKIIIEKAMLFCESINLPITYPVLRVADLGADTLALADTRTNRIYLSDRVLDMGTKQVAAALIEENLHLQKGLKDCTYDMQNFLFDQIVTMGERLTGEVL